MRQQTYKSIYFPDAPGATSRQKSITVAFGSRDADLHSLLAHLSSEQLRELIGHHTFASLSSASEVDGIGVSSFIKRQLRNSLGTSQAALLNDHRQASLEGFLDPQLVAYKSGDQESLHSWFPYLEGYSSAFVEQVLHKFAPDAEVVLDPFGGVGTTPITSARLGLEGLFCEVNPLLNQVIGAKNLALTLTGADRNLLTDRLRRVASEVPGWIEAFRPSESLRQSYTRLFSDSCYFSNEQLALILTARSAIDRVSRDDVRIGQLLLIAALASLMECSNLVRRGDVRFKTEHEAKRVTPNYLGMVAMRCANMATDIERLEKVTGVVAHLADDARTLLRLPRMRVDVVLTSPPYLNGTNYIRNTKLEMWFARLLVGEEDLRRFRTRTVTAGINDVNHQRILSQQLPRSITRVVTELADQGYDARIPRMIAGYFTDLEKVFQGVLKHLNGEGKLIIDIGDSEYAGVHVPTHRMLADILEPLGVAELAQITLRKRRSRGGSALTQTLLVFRKAKSSVGRRIALPSPISKAWIDFKQQLPHQSGHKARRNWGHPLHSLCSYQGKMKPALAASLVETFMPSKGKLLDPFAGVGTIPFEAKLHGHQVWAFDISPVAVPICRAKLEHVSPNECETTMRFLEGLIADGSVPRRQIESAQQICFNGPLVDYFDQRTLSEILIAREYFQNNPPDLPSAAMVFSALLHILHGNRPYALSRNSHPLTPFAPTGPTTYRALIPRLRSKVGRCLAQHSGIAAAGCTALAQDATQSWPIAVDELDAIITSPPFFDSVRFHLGNWMRLWFAGWDSNDFVTQPKTFIDERQKSNFAVYEPILRQAKERLRSGGVLVMHVGQSKKCNMAEEIQRVSKRWFKTVDVFDERVAHCETHGIRDKGTVSVHQYVVMV